MLSERIRNAGVGTFQEMWNEIADEAAKYERVARAAKEFADRVPVSSELYAALADLPEGALGG